MRRFSATGLLLLAVWVRPAAPMTPEERARYLQEIQKILPESKEFDAWLEKTHELPPDFDLLPRNNRLPDPLKFLNGKPVRTKEDWEARRKEIKDLFQKFVIG